jgi:hypothetical protein
MATTTPNYGWPVPTSTDYVKDGATAIEALGDAIDATVFALGSGLKLIKTQTIGSAVSSVTVTSAFSTTYEVYRIVVNDMVTSAEDRIGLTFNNSTGSTYNDYLVSKEYAGVLLSDSTANTTKIRIATYAPTGKTSFSCDIFSPFLTATTQVATSGASNTYNFFGGGVDKNAASQTGFTFTPGIGTMTGGTIRVYGYQKS